MDIIRKYGNAPYTIGLLHGGPGAAGEMRPVAEELSKDFSVLEFLQTKESIDEQIEELYQQIDSVTEEPITLVGFSWGAWLGGLFASRFPKKIKKLILISSGALDNKYNKDLMTIRLERLATRERGEANNLLFKLNSEQSSDNDLKRFGELMEKADSYCILEDLSTDAVDVNFSIYNKVWTEAVSLRKTGELKNVFAQIQCPVVAFHGDYDSHPIEGVNAPLSALLKDFKLIQLLKCGHTPWVEKYAKDVFYEHLRIELI